MTWPNLPDTATEERARIAWSRLLDELPPPPDLARLIHAQGERLRTGGKRGGWATAPHNWLERDKGWRDLSLALAAVDDAEARVAAARDRILADLGADVLVRLRRAGLREAEIDHLAGVTFEPAPVPRFVCERAFARGTLSKHHQGLTDVFGNGLRIELADERRTG